jgi:hypothetical protein
MGDSIEPRNSHKRLKGQAQRVIGGSDMHSKH